MLRYSIDPERVTWEVADGEAVVVHFDTSAYYALNRSGTLIWTRLARGPHDAGDLARTVAVSYGKAPGEITPDVQAFLERLRAEGLVVNGAPRAGAVPAGDEDPADPDEYRPPQLTRFGELASLILSGE